MTQVIPIEQPNRKYKRTVWLGVRDKAPDLHNLIHKNSEFRLGEYLDGINEYRPGSNMLPCLIVWENNFGDKYYAEAV